LILNLKKNDNRRSDGYQRLEMDLNEYLKSKNPEDQKKIEQEQATMNARFFLRGLPKFEFSRSLPDIGWFNCFVTAKKNQ